MASQTEVLKALHKKEGPTKTLDLAKELKTSDDTLIPARHGIQRSRASEIRRNGNEPPHLLGFRVCL